MKERLDLLLVKRNLFESRERARAFILGGNVSVDGETVRKPGKLVSEDAGIRLLSRNEGYASRGGLKLEGALEEFGLDVRGAYCLDIGASTGGFTDCLLKKGARHVVALDVGKNQLAYALRVDPRVTVVEGFNARRIEELDLAERLDLVTIDVSFISVERILERLHAKIDERASVVALIKPQFELGKPFRGFDGVVRDARVHRRVLDEFLGFCRGAGFVVAGLAFSRVRGPKGNIEFFARVRRGDPGLGSESGGIGDREADETVKRAHEFFGDARGGEQ